MVKIFNKSSRGYSHIRDNKPCQDFSASYKDADRVIITCCDGHGGQIYLRSQDGSKFASHAVIDVLRNIDKSKLKKMNEKTFIDQVKLQILCEYNKRVEAALSKHPLRKKELSILDEDQMDKIKFTPQKVYGTTLTGALLLNNKLLIVGIGDTEVIGMKNGELIKIFDDSNDPVGNITYSMCQENAFNHINVKLVDFKKLDAIFLATDGFSSPFQSYQNLTDSCLKPIVKTVSIDNKLEEVEKLVDGLADKLGIGDDVSLSFIIKDKVIKKYYR